MDAPPDSSIPNPGTIIGIKNHGILGRHLDSKICSPLFVLKSQGLIQSKQALLEGGATSITPVGGKEHCFGAISKNVDSILANFNPVHILYGQATSLKRSVAQGQAAYLKFLVPVYNDPVLALSLGQTGACQGEGQDEYSHDLFHDNTSRSNLRPL